jgi:molecular chaperone HtpG
VLITKDGVELEATTAEQKQSEEETKKQYEEFCKLLKEILGDRVEKVVVSKMLLSTPCCLKTTQFGWSANFERIMKAQALRDTSMTSYMSGKKVMEINPDHPIIQTLKSKADADKNDKTVKDLALLLFETALLDSGFSMENPRPFVDRVLSIILFGLGITDNATSAAANNSADMMETSTSNNQDTAMSSSSVEPPSAMAGGSKMEEVD